MPPEVLTPELAETPVVTAPHAPRPAAWDLVIRPHRGMFDWRLEELWRCRDLISLFVWRDFVAVYKQTILGPLWHILQPLLTTLTFTLIFGRVAGLPTEGVPGFLFYMSGTVLWTYFSTSLTKTANTFVANSGLYGKVYFHRLSIPVSVVISNLIAFAIQFGIFLGFLGTYAVIGHGVRPNAWVLLLPVLVVLLAGLSLGFGIIVSALTTRYRDLVHLVTFGVQLWMFATPVIYPASMVSARYRWMVQANPITPIVETFRHAFLGSGAISLSSLAYSATFTVAVLVCGAMLFNRVEQTFMDTV